MARVFFDLDGTLTDPQLGITRSIQYALGQLQAPVPASHALTWCIGPPLRESFSQLVPRDQINAAVSLYRERFADIGWSENAPYAGIHQELASLAQAGCQLYIASSKPQVFVERIIQHFDLHTFFTGIYGARLDESLADKSELLNHALRETNSEPNDSIMVGDRKYDAIGAQDNNMRFVGACYGFGGLAELSAYQAHALAHAPEQVSTSVLSLVL